MLSSCFLFIAYLFMVYKLIIVRWKTYDRFTLSLTFVSLVGSMLQLTSAVGAWYMSQTSHGDTYSKREWGVLYAFSQLYWYASVLLSVCFMVFAFKFYA